MSISSYIKETRAEFKFVKWPTRKQAIAYSLAVIGISVVMAYFLGALDFAFQQALAKLLGF
jgi:preprotein translocase subunit SecE